MFCIYCGNEMKETDKFCVRCGKAVKVQAPAQEKDMQQSKAPAYDEPQYGEPVQPGYTEPQYSEPAQAGYTELQYNEPVQAGYTEPQYSEPAQAGYTETQYGEPAQAGYTEPQFGEPAQPEYSEPQYSQQGAYGNQSQHAQYSQQGAYSDQGQYSQQGGYGDQGQYSQQGGYGDQGQYSQQGGYANQGQYGQDRYQQERSRNADAGGAKPPVSGIDFEEMKTSMKGFAAKAAGTASKAASSARAAATSAKEQFDGKMERDLEKKIEQANAQQEVRQRERAGLVSDEFSGTNYMSTTELWTWLKKDSRRQQYFTEDLSVESEDEYMRELTEKINENHVPAVIEKRNIEWDRSGAREDLYVIIPQTKVVNPLTYLVQFSHVGKFTFVEEKTFITPPNLPVVPHSKIPHNTLMDRIMRMAFLFALAFFIYAYAGGRISYRSSNTALFLLLGIACAGVGVYLFMKARKIDEYNRQCDAELRAWNEAWHKWRTSIFLHSFQEDINGQLSRIFDSVFTCISQINDVKFKDRKTLEDHSVSDMNELEQMISRKQKEYR